MEWIAVNILIPIFSPVIVMFAFSLLPPPPGRSKPDLMELLKDGQLGWVALAISCAATGEYNEKSDYFLKQGRAPEGWHLMVWLILLPLVFSTLTAVWGAVFSTTLRRTPTTGGPAAPSFFDHYKTFLNSAVWTLAASIVAMVLHFAFPTTGGH
ncbi:hypothetical protein [Bradyrhizobium liaoningense]|uniref:hypothetical protein n=1 Tax=Bradyrhizobium liaoningense TaxID=43992 RepID=UPI001BA7DA29|nr:hypothetical protein [Bradyrhizobium liaoningense]MBR1066494.1 hypothetical protein [Bradyrhizobium liaoningense]